MENELIFGTIKLTAEGTLNLIIISCFSVLISFIHNWSRSYYSQKDSVEILSTTQWIVFLSGFLLRVVFYSIIYALIIFIVMVIITFLLSLTF